MKRLVLLGGGHAHLGVLADLAERPLVGWDVHLVSPYRRQIYSGMLPGWVAGHYPIESCAIALDVPAKKARARFHETAARALDAADNEIACADGTRLNFDLLSIDTGPLPAWNSPSSPGTVPRSTVGRTFASPSSGLAQRRWKTARRAHAGRWPDCCRSAA